MKNACLKTFLVVATLVGLTGTSVATAADPESRRRPPHWRTALLNAARDPGVWAPAAGAAVFGLTGLDESVSDWAVRETPLFGSREGARRASDDLLDVTRIFMYGSAVVIPMREQDWNANGRRLLASVAAVNLTRETTSSLKSWAARDRPDGGDDRSFPSGHASLAFVYAGQAGYNIEDLDLPRGATRGLKIGFTTVASVAAWSRVEGGRHYPSDSLMGAALGRFLTRFMNEAFVPPDSQVKLDVNLDPQAPSVGVRWRF